MKSLLELSHYMKEIRMNQPQVTREDALAQAQRVATAKEAAGAQSGPPVFVSRQTWEDLLKNLCNSEAEVEHLRDTTETLSLQIADLETDNEHFIQDMARGVNQTKEILAKLDVLKTDTTRTLADREARIAKLLRELETTEGNRKYACDHILLQNQVIRDAKTTVATIRADYQNLLTEVDELRATKVNSEHLAKKVIQTQSDNVRIISENAALNALIDTFTCPYQKTKEIIHIPCGKCLSCKFEATMRVIEQGQAINDQLQKDLKTFDEELIFKQSVLEQTSQNVLAANKERDIAATQVRQITIEKDAANKMIDELKLLIRTQETALETVAEGSFFGHANIAQNALDRVKKLRLDKKLY